MGIRFFDMPTGEIGKLSQPGGSLFNIEHSKGGLITFPGGIPILSGNDVIGAIGVSGSSVENDNTVAQAGVDALSLKIISKPQPSKPVNLYGKQSWCRVH